MLIYLEKNNEIKQYTINNIDTIIFHLDEDGNKIPILDENQDIIGFENSIVNKDEYFDQLILDGWIETTKEEYDNSLLPSAKNIRKQYIINKRTNLADQGIVEYKGNTYSNAANAKTAILNYIVSLNDTDQGNYLTYPEQQFVKLSKIEFQELALLIQTNELDLRTRQGIALEAIDNAASIEEVNSIDL